MSVAVRETIHLAEWSSRDLPEARLSANDRATLDALVARKRLEYVERTSGLVLKSRGWIGVVRLEMGDVRVVPTLIDGYRSLVRLLAFVGDFNLLAQLDSDAAFSGQGDDLFDVMALLLARECDRVRQIGVLADYREQHDELSLLRGRLDAKAQATRRFGRVDTLLCEFDERVVEIPENRWLVRALRVARHRAEAPRVRDHARRSLGAWEELCEDASDEPLPKPELSRANAHYRTALELAYLVLDGVSASDLLTAGRIAGFSFMVSMPRLFEAFVTRLVQRACPPSSDVSPQRRDASVLWDLQHNMTFGTVRPDVVVSSGDGRVVVPIDAKYKRYGEQELGPADVYQGAIYALTLARGRLPGEVPTCLVVYPLAKGVQARQRVQVRISETALAEVDAFGIAVDDVLDEGELWTSRVHLPWLAQLSSMVA